VKQPHTEQSIKHTDDQQNTGNHKKPASSDAAGADRFGGTRAGADNVEGGTSGRDETIEQATDLDRVSGLDQPGTSTKRADETHARSPERDEHGRL
jgi:hypothetical protein